MGHGVAESEASSNAGGDSWGVSGQKRSLTAGSGDCNDNSESSESSDGRSVPSAEAGKKRARNSTSVVGRALLYPTLEELGLPLPPDVETAQQTAVFHKTGFLTAKRTNFFIRRFVGLGLQPYTNNSDIDYNRTGDWIHVTHYLQEGDAFRTSFSELRAAVLALAREANSTNKWGLDLTDPSFRCAEYHHYRPGGCLPEPEHYDKGSMVTVDVMLQEAESGGEFQTLEVDGVLHKHSFKVGDAIVFLSHKYHCVSPVVKGERRVLVCEIWSGEERTCGHRCELLQGECDFDPNES